MQKNDNTNNVNNNSVKLQDITGVFAGTSEYQAYGELGKNRREITGIIGDRKKANAFKIGSWIAKPFSVLGSSFGFAVITTLISNQELYSKVFFILFGLGLMVGIFFEYLSTANEDVFVKKFNKMTTIGIVLIVLIKSYAIYMHYQTASSISDMLVKEATTNNITSPKITAIQSQIQATTKAIEANEAMKSDKLIANTTSKYKAKREDALKRLEAIENKDEILTNRKSKLINQLAQLQEQEANKRGLEAKEGNRGLVWSFFMLLVIFEIGGTLLSILHAKTVLNSVDETIAMSEEVKRKLFTKKAEIQHTNETIKAFDVVNNIKANNNSIRTLEIESKIKEDELYLLEARRLADTEVNNSKLELENKIRELEIHQNKKMMLAINKRLDNINTIDTVITNESQTVAPATATSRKIGFNVNDNYEIVTRMFQGGLVSAGDKLTPRAKVITANNRSENERVTKIYNTLADNRIIERVGNKGYFAKADYQTALNIIKGV